MKKVPIEGTNQILFYPSELVWFTIDTVTKQVVLFVLMQNAIGILKIKKEPFMVWKLRKLEKKLRDNTQELFFTVQKQFETVRHYINYSKMNKEFERFKLFGIMNMEKMGKGLDLYDEHRHVFDTIEKLDKGVI